jgi:hypothetical protein
MQLVEQKYPTDHPFHLLNIDKAPHSRHICRPQTDNEKSNQPLYGG